MKELLQFHFSFFISYGGGTHPWNKSMGATEPSTEDGLIEVVGLTTYQLASIIKYYVLNFLEIE